MADHPVTLNVPEQIYEQARQVAEATSQPIEQVLIRRLQDAYASLSRLPPDEQAELAAFRFLSDDTLRGIAREQMPSSLQGRMVYLGDRNSRGTITTEEFDEYRRLVEQGERLMLRKAWAANVLMDRGYQLTGQDYVTQDE
jgi:hypothetical protein